jgi:WhiB family redox-sensing transcriptional regulator
MSRQIVKLVVRGVNHVQGLTLEQHRQVPVVERAAPSRGTREHGSLTTVPDQDWKARGACVPKEHKTELFYGDEEHRTTNGTRSSNLLAKKVCSGCPVDDECLRYALDNHERWGVWGGLTPRERDKMLRAREALRVSRLDARLANRVVSFFGATEAPVNDPGERT